MAKEGGGVSGKCITFLRLKRGAEVERCSWWWGTQMRPGLNQENIKMKEKNKLWPEMKKNVCVAVLWFN